MLAQYTKKLEECYKKKNPEVPFDYNSGKDTLTRIIIKLDELKYNFTQNDFNNFISLSVKGKYNNYYRSSFYKCYEEAKGNVFNIMFGKFTPSDAQFKIICRTCLGTRHCVSWVDILLKRGIKFDKSKINELRKIGYDIGKIISKEDPSIDNLKIIINGILKGNIELRFLTQMISKNKIVYPEDFLNTILMSLGAKCTKWKKIDTIIVKLLDYVKPNSDTIKILINKNTNLKVDTYKKLFENGMIPNEDLFTYFSKNYVTLELVFYGKKYEFILTTNIMNNMLKVTDKCNSFNESFLIDLGYPKDIVYKSFGKNFNILTFFEGLGILPNYETLEIAVQSDYPTIFDKCTIEYKMIPNLDLLNMALKVFNKDIVTKILCYKVVPDQSSFKIMADGDWYVEKEELELLIKFGLQITKDNVKQLLKNEIIVDNLERFGIDYDGDLYFWCHIYGQCPKEFFEKFKLKIDEKILTLRNMCRFPKTTVKMFTEYIDQNNVKPDRYCLELSCRYNKKIATYLIEEKKCDASINTFYFLNRIERYIHMLEKIVETYNLDDVYMSKSII
jgi:hypothetical protein